MNDTPKTMPRKTPVVPENSPFSRLLTYRLARVQTLLNAQGTRILREVAGISLVQWRILTVLGRLGESSSSQLGKEAQIDKGLLSRKLKTMIDKGLVSARAHKTDNRVQLLSLTPEGHVLHDHTLPHMSARQAVLTKHISQEDLDFMFNVLDKIEQAARSENEA